MRKEEGLTLIEILIVVSIMAILAGLVVLSLNPVRQFSKARNTQRWSHINTILGAIGQNIADNNGVFDCSAGDIPTTTTVIGTSGYDIDDCIAPTYTAVLPMDPTTGTTTDIGYSIVQDAVSGRITINADDAELGESVSVVR